MESLDCSSEGERMAMKAETTYAESRQAEAEGWNRRRFLTLCAQAGVTGTLLPGALYTLAAQAQEKSRSATMPITPELIEQAAAVAGVTLTEAQRRMMLEGVGS